MYLFKIVQTVVLLKLTKYWHSLYLFKTSLSFLTTWAYKVSNKRNRYSVNYGTYKENNIISSLLHRLSLKGWDLYYLSLFIYFLTIANYKRWVFNIKHYHWLLPLQHYLIIFIFIEISHIPFIYITVYFSYCYRYFDFLRVSNLFHFSLSSIIVINHKNI